MHLRSDKEILWSSAESCPAFIELSGAFAPLPTEIRPQKKREDTPEEIEIREPEFIGCCKADISFHINSSIFDWNREIYDLGTASNHRNYNAEVRFQ